MYGMPQASNYGQYGFAGYAGAPGAASPGMPQTASGTPGGAGLGLTAVGQQGAADPNAVAAAGQAQGQWPTGDPSSYYSNYWGGKLFFSYDVLAIMLTCEIGYYGQQATGQQGAADGQHQGAA